MEFESNPDKMAFNYPNYVLVGPINSGKTSFIKQIDEDIDLDNHHSTTHVKAHKVIYFINFLNFYSILDFFNFSLILIILKVEILNGQKKAYLVDTFGYDNKRFLRTQDELL